MQSLYNVIKKDCVNSNSVYTIKAPAAMKRLEQAVEADIPDTYLEDARILAESILGDAEREKAEILRRAMEEAERIKKDAYDMAFKKGYSEGLKKGTEDGYKNTGEIREKAKGMLEEAHRVTREYVDSQRQEIAGLAFCIAEKIIKCQIDMNESVVFNIVKDSIDAAVVKNQVVIRINPMDYALVECRMEELSKLIGESIIINLIRDGEIGRGGCRIESESTIVDAAIDSQLQNIKEILLG